MPGLRAQDSLWFQKPGQNSSVSSPKKRKKEKSLKLFRIDKFHFYGF